MHTLADPAQDIITVGQNLDYADRAPTLPTRVMFFVATPTRGEKSLCTSTTVMRAPLEEHLGVFVVALRMFWLSVCLRTKRRGFCGGRTPPPKRGYPVRFDMRIIDQNVSYVIGQSGTTWVGNVSSKKMS